MADSSIEPMVAQITDKLLELGLSPKIVKDYKYCGFGEIIKHFNEAGICEYTTEMADLYLKKIRVCYEAGEISQWKWCQIRKAAVWLEEFYTFGTITNESCPKWEVLYNPLRREPAEKELQDNDNFYGLLYRVKQEVMQLGISKKSIENYTCDGFDPLLRHFAQLGMERYSRAELDHLFADARRKLEEHLIGRTTYKNIRKVIATIIVYHDTGKLVWSKLANLNYRQPTPIFSKAINDYCETKLRLQMLSEHSVLANKSTIRQFIFSVEDMGFFNFSGLTRQIVCDALVMLSARYTAGMGNVIYGVRSFLSFAYETNLTEIPLHLSIPETASPRRAVRQGFTADEIKRVLAEVDRTTPMGKRDYAILVIGIQTGLRGIDVVNLKFQDINWSEMEIQVVQHKTGKFLRVPMEAATGNAIADYILHGRPDSDSRFIFLTTTSPHRPLAYGVTSTIATKYILKAEINRSSVTRRGYHSFRRSFGAGLLRSEVSLALLSELLGHSNIDSSKPYLSTDDRGMRTCAIGLSGIEVKVGELRW